MTTKLLDINSFRNIIPLLSILLLAAYACEGLLLSPTTFHASRATSARISPFSSQDRIFKTILPSNFNSRTAKLSRIVLASTPIKNNNTNNNNNSDGYERYNNDNYDANRKKVAETLIKSEERSTFWYSDPVREDILEDDVLPHEPNLDTDGPLPFGSYRTLGDLRYEPKRTCLMTVGLNFWNNRNHSSKNNSASGLPSGLPSGSGSKSSRNNTKKRDENEIDPNLIITNMHKLIDSGLTTFQINNPNESRSLRTYDELLSGMHAGSEQAYIEKTIYAKLIRDTPPSVLAECNLGTKVGVPHWNFGGTFGHGAMVREQIGKSLRNIYGRSNGCLDSVQVVFRPGRSNGRNGRNGDGDGNGHDETMSPFTLDVMDTLIQLQREGSIRSIHGVGFPSEALEELSQCGFHFDSNQMTCNLLNPSRFDRGMYAYCKKVDTTENGNSNSNSNHNHSDDPRKPMRMVWSSPLAGGLLTEKYAHIPNSYQSRSGEIYPTYMTPSEKKEYDTALKGNWRTHYQSASGTSISRKNAWLACNEHLFSTMSNIALKHRVDVASVALRWTMQFEYTGSVSVSSSLNSQFDDEKPFHRPTDLRKAFRFHLDEEDLERLWSVAGGVPPDTLVEPDEFSMEEDAMGIDFSNRSLWL